MITGPARDFIEWLNFTRQVYRDRLIESGELDESQGILISYVTLVNGNTYRIIQGRAFDYKRLYLVLHNGVDNF